MRVLIIAATVFFIRSTCHSQEFIPPPRTNYFDIVAQMDAYFDSLHRNLPDTLIYQEGGVYNSYLKWKRLWASRITAFGGDFAKYFENQKNVAQYREAYCGTEMTPWWEIGPTKPPALEYYNYGQGPIRFIRINQSSPSAMVCGSHSGGLYYTTDAGATWQNGGSDVWDKSSCHDATYKPGSVSTCYAISNGDNHYMGWMGGVYRTTNLGSGNTWKKVADANIFGIWNHLHSINVDPVNGNTAVVGTDDGLFRTTNINAPSPSWTPWNNRILPGHTLYDIQIQPGTTNVLYAAVKNNSGSTWALYRSNNFGANWSPVILPSGPISTSLPTAFGITIEFNNALPNILYVLVNKPGSLTNDELWKFDIPMNNWTLLDATTHAQFARGHGFGVAHSSSSEVVYLSHFTGHRVYDNGTMSSFSAIDYHVDVEDFAGHPANPDEVWMANHGGVYKSTDKGKTWTNKSIGLGVAEVNAMAASYQNPEDILVGLYHDGTQLTQGNYYNNWVPDFHVVQGGDGYRPLIDNADPLFMHTSSQNGNWRHSTDGGLTSGFIPYVGGNFETEGALNRVDPKILYRVSGSEVFRSFNRGASPNDLVSNFTSMLPSGYVVFKVFTGFNHKDRLYAKVMNVSGVDALFVNKKINDPNPAVAAASWIHLPLPSVPAPCSPFFVIADVEVDLTNPDIVYLAGGGGAVSCQNVPNGSQLIFKADYSAMGQAVFTDITYNLPNTHVSRIALEKGSNGGIYVATDAGVYYTNNALIANQTYWICFNSNLPNTRINDMEINYKINKIRVGFFGRGVWETDLFCPPDWNLTLFGLHNIDTWREVRNDIYSTAVVPNTKNVTYRAGNLIRLSPGFAAVNGSRFHAFIHPCNHAGNSFNRIAADEEIGTGLDEPEKNMPENSFFDVFPNPNNGSFTVRFGNAEYHDVLVTDVTGKVVKDIKNIKDKKTTIDLRNLTGGLYFVKVTSDNFQEVKKIMVQR